MWSDGRLEAPQGTVHPDSPMEREEEPCERRSPMTPRSEERRSQREMGGNSAATAYNVMRKWNLKFSVYEGVTYCGLHNSPFSQSLTQSVWVEFLK